MRDAGFLADEDDRKSRRRLARAHTRSHVRGNVGGQNCRARLAVENAGSHVGRGRV
jgi:hypothetical protein